MDIKQLLSQNRLKISVKAVILAIMLALFGSYRLAYQIGRVQCLRDTLHHLTSKLNSLLQNGIDSAYIGIGQVIIDGWVCLAVIMWFTKYKNARPIWAAGLFFGIRAIFLNIEAFPFPYHIVWHSPGFFSLAVPYDHTRDFFYSGHTGIIALLFLESLKLKSKLTKFALGISLIYMMSMLIITRVHYTIDIIGGLIFALFTYRLIQQKLFYFDWLLSSPVLLSILLLKRIRSRFFSLKIYQDRHTVIVQQQLSDNLY